MYKHLIIFLAVLLAGCTAYTGYQLDQRYGKADPSRYDSWRLKSSPVEYRPNAKPILDSRCAVCHGCYDATLPIATGSYEGITRGGSKNRVYDTTRLLAAEPTRLFVDAQHNAQWRRKDFSPC